MRDMSFFWKILGITVAGIFVALVVSYLTARPELEKQYARQTEHDVGVEARLLRAIAAGSWNAAEERFDLAPLEEAARGMDETRLTLIAANGVVIFDNRENPAVMDNHGTRPEVLHPGKAVTRFSRTLDREMTYFALPVEIDGVLRAHARAAISSADRDERAAELVGALQRGALISGLVALVLALVFSRTVTRPLREIAALVGEVGRHTPARRLHAEGNDEVARLARAVNTMADELQRKLERVERDGAEREAILKAMASGLLALDGEQRVLFANSHARRLLSLPAGEIKGKHLWELSRKVELSDLLGSEEEAGQPRRTEASLVVGGGERQVELSAVTLPANGDAPGGFVLVMHDITELRRLEAVRRDFVSNVSHELKTPLTAMAGYLEAVLEDPEMPDAQRQAFLTKASQSTGRLTAIVTDLLSLSRLESEEASLELVKQHLLDVIDGAIGDVADLASSRDIFVDTRLGEADFVPVRAEAPTLTLAITNLLSNAVKYAPRGQTVTLRLAQEGGEVRIDVIDHGPGIPSGEQDRIFERFYRIDKARSRKLGGTGLGLSIVRHVMAAHGGRVELESAVGKGSTFRLVLPLAP